MKESTKWKWFAIGLRKTKAGIVQQSPAEGLCVPLQTQGVIQWKPSNIQGRFQQLEGETHNPTVEFVQLLGAPSTHPKMQPRNTGNPSGRALSHEKGPTHSTGQLTTHISITERLELEGTSKIIQFQSSCCGQGCQPLNQAPDQVAHSPIQNGLVHLQGWGIHNVPLCARASPLQHATAWDSTSYQHLQFGRYFLHT